MRYNFSKKQTYSSAQFSISTKPTLQLQIASRRCFTLYIILCLFVSDTLDRFSGSVTKLLFLGVNVTHVVELHIVTQNSSNFNSLCST